MKQSCAVFRRWGATFAKPGIQPNVMMVPASRDKSSVFSVGGDQFKSQQTAVEVKGTLKVRYL